MRTVLTSICYNLFYIVPAEFFLALFGGFFKKIKMGLDARKEWLSKLHLANSLAPKGDRILFHVSSAGELQQALPVIRELKSAHPEWQFVISFYSVSGMNFFHGDPAVAFVTFMPFDSPKNSTLFMNLIRPKVYAIASWDMWFNHCLAARNVGAKVVLFAGILSPDSSRLKFPLRWITGETFRLFHKIFSVSDGDAQRIRSLTGNAIDVETAGDPRYDHILKGISNASVKLAQTSIPVWEHSRILTLGSIWEADWEIVANPLLEMVCSEKIKVFAAPHQMKESFLQKIEFECESRGVFVRRFSKLESSNGNESVQVIVIDTIGILAALYSKSQFAYVGGAFGKGVHNVAEPAAFGLPLWFGPKFEHSLEACRAVETAAAKVVLSENEFQCDLQAVVDDFALFEKRSVASRSVIHNFAGSTLRISDEITKIMLLV